MSERAGKKRAMIHPSSFVDEGAQVGDGTKIWYFCHIMPKVKIGRDCNIGQNVFVGNHVSIGDGVKIQNNVSVYEGVTLEDYVFCGPSMVFTNVKLPRAKFPVSTESYDKTHVGEGATIGANATVVCGTTIGKWAIIGAGTVVTKDIPDYAVVWGVPAKQKAWACMCGETLKFSGAKAQCKPCKRSYKKSGQKITLLE